MTGRLTVIRMMMIIMVADSRCTFVTCYGSLSSSFVIGVKFPQHTISDFKAYNSGAVSAFTLLCK